MRYLVLLLAAVAVHAASSLPKPTPEAKACHETLMKDGERDAMKAVMDKCISEQAGLADIIKTLIPAPPSGGPPGGPGGRKPGGPGGPRGPVGPGGPGGPGDIFAKLVAAGNTAAADTLKKCMARAHGHMTTSGTFDVAKFKSELVAKVTGTAVAVKTQLGIDNCPVDALNSFDVPIFMMCVMTYCATGAAPTG